MGKRIEKNWTQEELRIFIKLYPFFKNEELALYFKRTVNSIQHKATRLGLKKDEDAISVHKSMICGEKSPSWKGGRKINKKGHVLVWDKHSPYADVNGYVLEHRKVMIEHLGRPLEDNEVVHHINGDKTDNRIENLELMDRGEHTKLHHVGSKRSYETKLRISEARRKAVNDK